MFLENIRQDAMEDFANTVNIYRRAISNLRSADDIDRMGGNETELQELTTCANGMKFSTAKSNEMVIICQYMKVYILMDGEQFDEVAPSNTWVQSSRQREAVAKKSEKGLYWQQQAWQG